MCVLETMSVFEDGNWPPSLLPMPRYMATYDPEYHMDMLHRLQTCARSCALCCFNYSKSLSTECQ